MPEIGIADKITLDQVKTLIGAASPASGDLTTLFKGLKLLADYVDTLETKIGLSSDAAGITTLFARLAQIAGYTDTVETVLGTVQKARGLIRSRIDITSASYVNLVNVSGKGRFMTMIISTAATSCTMNIIVLIDGVQVLAGQSTTGSPSTQENRYAGVGLMANSETNVTDTFEIPSSGFVPVIFGFEFKSSLQIQAKTSTGTMENTVFYSIE